MIRDVAFRVAALSFLAGLTHAQDAPQAEVPAPREWVGGAPLWEWTRLTGDWGGLRNSLTESGIEVSGGYTVDLSAPWSGDTRRRSSAANLLDVNAAFDLEQLLGLRRTLFYVDAYKIYGSNPSNDVGDFGTLSNIASTDVAQIAELWLETWLGDSVRVKAGKVDFNSEFAFHEIGGEFVNSTAAIVPTIVAYPTFPNPATSVNVFWSLGENSYLGAAVYDGANAYGIQTGKRGPSSFFSDRDSDAYFYAVEAGTGWAGGERWGSGRTAIGAFHHSASFTRFDGNTDRGTEGLWWSIEQVLWREDPTATDPQGVGAFLSLGFADDAVSACGFSLAAGVEWTGAIAGRDFDVLGFGLFLCDLSDDAAAGTPEDELALELLYKAQLTPAVSLKPELQYIVHPGGIAGVDDVLVGLLRLEVLF